VIAEPLGFQGERLGVGIFEYGAYDTVLLGELRQAISASVKGALLTRALEEAKREVEALAVTDPLTGLYNRRHLTLRLTEEHSRARRHQRHLSVVMLDLDGFKRINDNLGHDAGDEVLKSVARVLKKGVRHLDTIARFGGDEFVIVLPATPRETALQVARRILEAMRADKRPNNSRAVGASLGIASVDFSSDAHSPDEELLLKHADHAMLAAKRLGKNRVCHFDDCDGESPLSGRSKPEGD
jgi:diguanylate cyclase (GGDEF)-like protein